MIPVQRSGKRSVGGELLKRSSPSQTFLWMGIYKLANIRAKKQNVWYNEWEKLKTRKLNLPSGETRIFPVYWGEGPLRTLKGGIKHGR